MVASAATIVMSHIKTISEWKPGPFMMPIVGISRSLTSAETLILPSL